MSNDLDKASSKNWWISEEVFFDPLSVCSSYVYILFFCPEIFYDQVK